MKVEELQIRPPNLHDCVTMEMGDKTERNSGCFAKILKTRNSLLIPKSFIKENRVREGDFLFFVNKCGRLHVKVYPDGEK